MTTKHSKSLNHGRAKTTRIALLITLSFVIQLTSAGVYKWIDSAGQVHYSDRPVSGAEIQEMALPAEGRQRERTRGDQDGESVVYDEIEIVSPEEDQTIRSDGGTVDLGIVIRPPLIEDHRVQILIDGAPISGATDGAQFSLNGVPYGSHSVQAIIIDYKDQPVASSTVVNFHLRKPLPPTATVE